MIVSTLLCTTLCICYASYVVHEFQQVSVCNNHRDELSNVGY